LDLHRLWRFFHHDGHSGNRRHPVLIFGWWLLRFSKRNIQTVEDAYSEHLASVVSRGIAIAIAAVLVSSVAFAQTPASRPGVVAAPPADANGFKIGDTVEINTGLGWMKATILSVNGNNYRVRSEVGIELTKTYPTEYAESGHPPRGTGPPASTTFTIACS
jgi:hypothetical protein